jgi:hypothetical protein
MKNLGVTVQKSKLFLLQSFLKETKMRLEIGK